jgi:tetratricopeptide (TPR) repeat protein
MNAAPDSRLTSVDDQLRHLRTLVYEQDETAASVAVQLREKLELYTLRARLLDQLREPPAPATASELVRITTDLEEWATRDADIALDVATVLLTTSADMPLLERTLAALHDSFVTDDMSTLPALRFLLMSGHANQAARLLRALVPATVGAPSRAPEDDSSAPFSTGTGSAASLLSGVVVLCQQVLERDPRNDEMRRILTWSLIELGRLEQALTHAETLLAKYPGDEELMWYRVAALDGLGRPQEALSALDTLPRAALDDSAVISYRLRLMLDSGLASQALDLAKSAMRGHPDDVKLTLAYIEALDRTQGHDEALATAREAFARHPDSPRLAVATGGLLVEAERFSEAIPLLQNAVLSGQGGSDAARLLAAALRATGSTAEALHYLDIALSTKPLDGMLLVERARTLQDLGRLVEALDAVDAAERSGTSQPSLWVLRGDLLLALGRESEAISQYSQALAEGPDELTDDLVQRLESSALDAVRDRPHDALSLLVAVNDTGRLSCYGHALYAETLRLNGQLEHAITEADRARQAEADVGWVAGTKARALADLARSAEALEALDEIGYVDPEDRFNLNVRIDALLALDRYSEADELLERHFPVSDQPKPDEEPDDWLTWSVSARGLILNNRDELEEVRARIRRYTRRYGRQTSWDYWTAVSYNRGMHHDRALPLLSRVADEWGDSGGWVWCELGDALVASGGVLSQEARDAYKRIVQVSSEYSSQLSAQAWARFRLGDTSGAAEAYQRTLVSGTDPMREDRLRLVLIHHAAGDSAAAEDVLREVLRDLANVPDRQRARGILSEGMYVLTLVLNDPQYGPPFEQVWRDVREKLQACKRSLLAAR